MCQKQKSVEQIRLCSPIVGNLRWLSDKEEEVNNPNAYDDSQLCKKNGEWKKRKIFSGCCMSRDFSIKDWPTVRNKTR